MNENIKLIIMIFRWVAIGICCFLSGMILHEELQKKQKKRQKINHIDDKSRDNNAGQHEPSSMFLEDDGKGN